MEEWNNRLSNPELRCKNNCGFYGNPIYQGYCSKCFKEVTKRHSRQLREKEIEDEVETNSGLGFTRFAFKKITNKGQHKILKGSPMKKGGGSSSTASGSSKAGWQTTSLPAQETQNVQDQPKKKSKGNGPRSTDPFNEFMKTLKKPAAQDIVQHLKIFKKQVHDKVTATIAEQSEMVQQFYETTSQRLESHPLFNQMIEEEQSEMMDGIEKHLMTSIYNKVFSPASCDDEVKDILLLRRINMLHWLKPSDLDVALDMNNLEVQNVFEQARQELWNMENKKAPQDKLSCICRSCTKLFEALQISQGGPASADEFLPALIFLIIHTSCQNLYSNMNYIERFSQPVRLMSGETGYYFTNLCGAVMFIDNNINAESLKLTQEEFNCKMGYVDGKTDADLLIEELDVNEDYERIVVLQSCCAAMGELTNHLQDMCAEIDILEDQITEFQVGVKQQVESILSRPPPRSLYKKTSPPTTHGGPSTSPLPPSVPGHRSHLPPVPDRKGGSSLPSAPVSPPFIVPYETVYRRPIIPPIPPPRSSGPRVVPSSHDKVPVHIDPNLGSTLEDVPQVLSPPAPLLQPPLIPNQSTSSSAPPSPRPSLEPIQINSSTVDRPSVPPPRTGTPDSPLPLIQFD